MPINFLCIDDEGTDTLRPYLDLIEKDNPEISIKLIEPEDLDSSIDTIKDEQPDGLILDLRLDKKVNYRGSTLAQEIRTRMVEGDENMPSCPIILWSVDENLRRSYDQDDTAHDLFDLIFIKDEIDSKQAAAELVSLCSGYDQINYLLVHGSSEIYKMLFLSEEESEMLDPRIGDIFMGTDKPKSVHEYARYIHKEIILTQGPLIDQYVLAARFGIDIETSPAWDDLKSQLSDLARYHGVFGDAWPRWWARKMEDWWLSFSESNTPLRRLQAPERVEILNRKMGEGAFSPASPIEEGYGMKYWTICRGFKKPLDTSDGLLAATPELKPWQDPPYLSIKAALERVNRSKGVRVHPLERERLSEIKEQNS